MASVEVRWYHHLHRSFLIVRNVRSKNELGSVQQVSDKSEISKCDALTFSFSRALVMHEPLVQVDFELFGDVEGEFLEHRSLI